MLGLTPALAFDFDLAGVFLVMDFFAGGLNAKFMSPGFASTKSAASRSLIRFLSEVICSLISACSFCLSHLFGRQFLIHSLDGGPEVAVTCLETLDLVLLLLDDSF